MYQKLKNEGYSPIKAYQEVGKKFDLPYGGTLLEFDKKEETGDIFLVNIK